MKECLVFDLSYFIFRSYHGLKPLHTSKGVSVHALYGVVTSFLSILHKYPTAQVFVASDGPREKSLRREEFQEYKMNRPETPSDLIPQFQLIDNFFKSLHIEVVRSPGFEADDVIASFVSQKKNSFDKIYLLTGDKDLMQLVDDRTYLLNTKDFSFITPAEVFKKFGVHPHQIGDYLSLVGDISDNIPGVKGIGKEAAKKLLHQFHSVSQIKLEEIPNKKIQTALRETTTLEISKKLVTLDHEIQLISQESYVNLTLPSFKTFLQEVEFFSLLKKYFPSEKSFNDKYKLSLKEYYKNQNTFDEEYEDLSLLCFLLNKPYHDDINELELFEEIMNHPQLSFLYKLEKEICFILSKMELEGILIDEDYFKQLKTAWNNELKTLEEKIFLETGETFNVHSPKQLSVVLFEKLRFPIIRKTKTGASTDNEVLETLKKNTENPLFDDLIAFREYDKLLTTYVENFLTLQDTHHRLHPTFNQTKVITGRLSCEKPNLQNIPIKSPLGQSLRKGFISSPGKTFICADYSQIELRVLAHFSQDPLMLDFFQHKKDIHFETALKLFPKVTDKERSFAKTINFGILYGQGAQALAQQLHISYAESKNFILEYFKQFPSIKNFIEKTKEDCRNNLFVTTLLGRKRSFPEIHSSQAFLRAFAERACFNTLIQGSAADLIKLSMQKVFSSLESNEKLLLQIHDELIFECPDDKVSDFIQKIYQQMISCYELSVPLDVSIKIGKNLQELTKIKI